MKEKKKKRIQLSSSCSGNKVAEEIESLKSEN